MNSIKITLITAVFSSFYNYTYSQVDSTKKALTKKEISVSNFTSIEAGGTFNLIISEGNTALVTIETCPENQENIKAEVNNEKLILTMGSKKFKGCNTKVFISAPVIQHIQLGGSADAKSEGELNEEKLTINMSGASEANFQINVKQLETELSGAAELRLKGVAENHTTQMSGAGELKAIDLTTQNTTAKLSGAADARVNAKNQLNAKISGAASISYKDEPAVKNIDVSGAGSASQKDIQEEIVIKSDTDVNGNSDTTRFKFKDKKIIIIDSDEDKKDKKSKRENKNKNRWHHWSGLELGINGILNAENTNSLGANYKFLEQNYGSSFNFNINFLEKDFNVYEEKINIVTGLGLEFANYSLANKVTLIPDTNRILAYTTNLKYEKNKLRANYLNVPLLIDFNSSNNSKKNWHFTTGIIAGWRYGAFTKQIYTSGGNKIKTKIKDDYTLNDFKFSATVRIGYRNINVWANYGLNTLFNRSNNPDFYPVAAGITFLPFK